MSTRILGNLLILFGLFCLLFGTYIYWLRVNPKKYTFENAHLDTTKTKTTLQPEELIIDDVHVDLPIFQAKIKNNEWGLTDKGVSYLDATPLPGDKGNSVIYGHNWSSLLGPLQWTHPGEHIKIRFNDGSSRDFTIQYTAIITPDQTHILDASKDKRVTLYTCTGFLDSKRFVAVATVND